MVRHSWALAALSCVSSASAISYVTHSDRLAAIEDIFQVSWDGYYKYAFPHDSLLPISRTWEDDRNGWGASAVDAISTALIMGNQEVVDIVVEHIKTVNFTMTAVNETSVSLFETTIRYLGGMLSAHDFLAGPRRSMLRNESDLAAILGQATTLAEQLSVAFDTPSGVPINDLIFNGPDGPVTEAEDTNGLATIGSLVLEWTRLSDLTGDAKWAELSQKGESYLLTVLNPEVGEPYPGLLGSNVNVTTGEFVDSAGSFNGGTDSFYEYLIKMYIYDTERFAYYKERWTTTVDSSIRYMTSHPTTRPDLTFVAAWNGPGLGNLSFEWGHLGCFYGGNVILGGLVLDNAEYLAWGEALVAGCHDTYASEATRIGPETFQWQDSRLPRNASNNAGAPVGQQAFYRAHGFWTTTYDYDERPEVMESYYYAYRATGDPKYQDWAWDALLAINATCRAGAGYSDIDDVTVPGGGGFADHQETFWFAEVLKYAYLIQAGEAAWQVSASGDNQFVFNTEAHPLKVAGTPV
ncbi:glycoside hydrolase family 47 protein [Xylariaceae sp. FL0804]|nr:glycoside hydrolase family 47 protein [Xylariaceae sp. FL0804]